MCGAAIAAWALLLSMLLLRCCLLFTQMMLLLCVSLWQSVLCLYLMQIAVLLLMLQPTVCQACRTAFAGTARVPQVLLA
jgi:hypothetical protein